MQPDSIKEITKRTQRYWYEDGIWEIGFGAINLLLGLFYLLVAPINWVGPLSFVLVLLQVGVVLGAFRIINRLVTLLKERITYPRTGYVAYRKPASISRLKRAIYTALIAGGIGALVGALETIPSAQNRTALVMAIVYAAVLIYFGFRFSLARMYAVVALVILWGYWISRFALTDLYSSAAFFGGVGALILASGFITLLLYLRRTQPANKDLFDTALPDDQLDKNE